MNTEFRTRWYQLTEQFACQEAVCHTSRRITYRQLTEQANAYAWQLTDLGIHHSCVPVLIDSPADHIAALLGILLSGNYYYSINLEQASRINLILQSVGALALIGPTDLIDPTLLPDSLALIQPDRLQPQSLGPSHVGIDPATPFCLFTTSGTTGEPKQVIHSHQSVLTDTDRQILDNQISSSDRIDLLFSLEFSASLACVFPALLTGATLVIHDLKKEGVFSLPAFWQREQISVSTLSVSTFRLLLKSKFDFKTLQRLRLLSIGAEPVYRRDIEGFQAQFGQQTTLQIAYATTETRTITEQKIRTDTTWNPTLDSVGKSVAGRVVRIQDETGNWLAPGKVGEIVVQSMSIPFGYTNNPVASQRAYHRQVDGLVSYASGDLGYLDKAGYLFWCGRTDFMIKKNGQKINLLDLEDVLGQVPGVIEAAVVSDLDTHEQPFILAFLRSEPTLELTTVKRWMAEHLSNVMLPDYYQFLPELPRTRTGKVDRSALLYHRPVALPTSLDFSNFPIISLVDQIKIIWTRALNYPAPIADYDDFFRDLGGDSLKAEACLATLEAHIGKPLPMQLAFSYPTALALAGYITTPPKTGVQCISLNQPVANRPNIYFIPPLLGDKRIYVWLEESLGAHANLYCFYFTPFSESGKLRSLPELCDSMAHLIDTSVPNLLIGYSFGGILAYEISLRLDRQSPQHQLNRLVLIDTPLYKRYPFGKVIVKDLIRGLHKIRRVFTTSEPFSWSANIQQLVVRYWSRLQAPTPLLPLSDWQQKANFAAHTYSQQVVVGTPINRPIVLFKATDTSFYQKDIRPNYEWQTYARAGIEEHLLATNHHHVLNQVNSEQIIDVLRRILII